MTCKWSMDEYTDWWAGCTEGFTGWTDNEPPTYCPDCGERVEVEKRQLVYVRTCHLEERHGDWYCTNCGEMIGTSDPASELFIDGNAIEEWHYCPYCGAKVVE